jgi:hypothetical protein
MTLLLVSVLLLTWISAAGADQRELTLPRTLAMMDAAGNGDGKVQRDEIPARYAARFDELDTDGDGVLTAAEVAAVREREIREVPVFEDVLGGLSRETLDLLGGTLYEVGFMDGTLHDASRDREMGRCRSSCSPTAGTAAATATRRIHTWRRPMPGWDSSP